MKNLCYVIALAAIAISLLTACDKEEEETYVPGPYSWDFGYIRGTLNGTDFSLQNEGRQGGRYLWVGISAYTISHNPERTTYSTDIPITKDQYNGLNYGFSIFITPVETGVHEVGIRKSENDCVILFVDKRNADEKKIYSTLKQPMKLSIIRADFSPESDFPFIEGVMDGVLYNKKDMNDSIIVENVEFGVHE